MKRPKRKRIYKRRKVKMEILIEPDQLHGTNLRGETFKIEGIEIAKVGGKVFYDTDTSYYRAVAASGTKSNAFLTETGTIILT